jgi:dUTP pyrophosphatase
MSNKVVTFTRTDTRAVIPTRAHADDTGYDLTSIAVYRTLDNGVVMYDTGLSVRPPPGYYIEILPRSSLSKTGYMLANSVGVIDSSYRGNLYIAVRKVDKLADPLELPFSKFQLVLRKLELFELEEVDELDATLRGDGGFGSSDKI